MTEGTKNHPIQVKLKNLRRDYLRKYPNKKDATFRVPLDMADIEETILIFEDNDYYKRAIDTISDQVDDLRVELETVETYAASLYKNAEKFGAASDAKRILEAVERIREYLGKGEFDADDEGQES